ncbi:hypothetical protein HFP68_28320 [Bacillus sp. CB28A.1]
MNNIIQEFGDISSNIEIKYEQTDRHVKHLDSVYLEEVENLTYNGLYVITGGLGESDIDLLSIYFLNRNVRFYLLVVPSL